MTIVTGGESSDPGSKHFSDQASGYLGGVFKECCSIKKMCWRIWEKKYHPGEDRKNWEDYP